MQFARVIGHRGACGYAPENTKISMLKAYELGVSWVEFDVMLTADKVPVVIHDESLERTTNGKGLVAQTSYQELCKLDAGSWFSSRYAGQRIPSLRDLIFYLDELGMSMNVEIKANPGDEEQTVEVIIQELHQLSQQRLTQVIVSSFCLQTLRQVRKSSSDIAVGYLIDSWETDWQRVLHELDCTSLHVDQAILTAEKIAEIKNTNKKILSYTVNSPRRAQQLFDLGVDSVFSDFPDRIFPVVKLTDDEFKSTKKAF